MSNLPQPPDRERIPREGSGNAAPLEEATEPPANKTGGSRWSLARPRLGVAWITAVLVAYYLLHFPFSQSFLTTLFAPARQLALDWQTPLRLLGHAADVLVAAWLLLLGAALGRQ